MLFIYCLKNKQTNEVICPIVTYSVDFVNCILLLHILKVIKAANKIVCSKKNSMFSIISIIKWTLIYLFRNIYEEKWEVMGVIGGRKLEALFCILYVFYNNQQSFINIIVRKLILKTKPNSSSFELKSVYRWEIPQSLTRPKKKKTNKVGFGRGPWSDKKSSIFHKRKKIQYLII